MSSTIVVEKKCDVRGWYEVARLSDTPENRRLLAAKYVRGEDVTVGDVLASLEAHSTWEPDEGGVCMEIVRDVEGGLAAEQWSVNGIVNLDDPTRHGDARGDDSDFIVIDNGKLHPDARPLCYVPCSDLNTCSEQAEYIVKAVNCHAELLAALKLLLALPAVELIKYEYEQSLQFGGDQATAKHFPALLAAYNALAKAEGRAG